MLRFLIWPNLDHVLIVANLTKINRFRLIITILLFFFQLTQPCKLIVWVLFIYFHKLDLEVETPLVLLFFIVLAQSLFVQVKIVKLTVKLVVVKEIVDVHLLFVHEIVPVGFHWIKQKVYEVSNLHKSRFNILMRGPYCIQVIGERFFRNTQCIIKLHMLLHWYAWWAVPSLRAHDRVSAARWRLQSIGHRWKPAMAALNLIFSFRHGPCAILLLLKRMTCLYDLSKSLFLLLGLHALQLGLLSP